jgi:anti-anti-sigma factor
MGRAGGAAGVRFDVRSESGFRVIHLTSELGVLEYVGLEELFTKLRAAGPPRILLEMSCVVNINTTCGAVIVENWKQAAEAGGYFAIVNPSEAARKFLHSAGVDHLVECFASVEEAIEACPAAE